MSQEVLDLNEFLERVQDDKELLLELLDIYSEDFPGKRKGLEAAADTNDAQEVRSIAHSLKGASGNISAKNLRELFMKIEDASKDGDVSQVKSFLAEIDKQYAALSERISQLKAEFQS